MVKLIKSSRLVSAIAWSVIVGGAIVGFSGCKQVSTWTNTAPAPSNPSPDPFNYPPTSDSFYHRQESEPSLSPVPGLPAPGHSTPIDPPPSPVPEETNSSGSSAGFSSKLRSFRLTSFFNRKDSKSGAVQSAAAVNDRPQSTTGNRTTSDAGLGTSTSLSGADREPVVRTNETRTASRPYLSDVPSQNSVPARPLVNPQGSAQITEPTYIGPVITPGSQYTTGRPAPVESWPYTQRAATDRPTVQFRKQAPVVTTEDFAPKAAAQPSAVQPPEKSSPSSAAMPLLLPPGP